MQRAAIPIFLLSLCVLATCEKLPPSGVTHASYGAPDLTAPRRRLEAEAKGAAQGGGRIAYGAFAKPGQFPYAAKLFISKSEGYFGCGGALITPRAVLTAAHCVYDNNNKQVSPQALELLIGVTDASVPAPSYFADRIITPKYNPATTFGDVAIVRLTQAVVNATTVAMLAPTTQVKDGWRLTVYGWGQQPKGGNTNRLSFATMTKTTTAKCNSLHVANGMGTRPVDHFCVGPDSSSKHSCPGDSGGPFVYRGPKGTSRPIIAGIVSYGPFDYECGDKGNFDVATSIPYWRKWIDAQIKTYKLRR